MKPNLKPVTRGRALELALAVWVGCLVGVTGAWETNRIRAAVDIPTRLPGSPILTVQHSTAVSVGPAQRAMFLDISSRSWARRVGIDALMVVSNQIVISFDVDFRDGTNVYADEDLVAYNPVTDTFSLFFDGTPRIPASADLDAVARYLDDSQFLFSIDAPAAISGSRYDNKDVLLFNGTTVSRLYYGTTDLKIPARCNLDGLYYEGGKIYFSLDVTALINGLTGTDADVWVYDPAGGTTTLAMTNRVLIPDAADLTALDYPTDNDGDWLSDYEESTGLDEISMTFPGTSVAFSPVAITDPFLADTDGDGMPDGQETYAETSPTNRNDSLRLISLQSTPAGDVLTWTSVLYRYYAVDAGSHPTNLDTLVADDVWAENNTVTLTNLSLTSNYFYRVRVK